ncbi:MAG TPA: CRISPR system precrRNA processing endoribonuclease RAMP protein Cas6, partial [Blastocatellia bacterium]|nr:CRISPR system precrRNA processing endoribonuclease RAMP protein Cas6 [Blastocatellia bacterium]
MFLGSTLRGAFGHALKQAVCVMSHRACERCLVQDRCIYPYLFETPAPPDAPLLKGQNHAPHPFILTPPFPKRLSGSTESSASQSASQYTSRPIAPLPPRAISSRSATPVAAGYQSHGRPSGVEIQTVAGGASSPRSLTGGDLPRLVKGPVFPARYGHPALPILSERTLLKKGESLPFDLVLIGRAIDYLPYVVYAVTEMARRGLGADRNPFELDDVSVLGCYGVERSIYSGTTQKISVPGGDRASLGDLIKARMEQYSERETWSSFQQNGADTISDSPGLTLNFLTPTRIKINGEPRSAPSFDLLVRSLLRRVAMLFSMHGSRAFEVDHRTLIERAREVGIRRSKLRWWDFERYSNRQGRKVKLGGFVGDVEYEIRDELLAEFLPLLAGGEILHIGSNTTFGLGLCRIVHCWTAAITTAGRDSKDRQRNA